MVAFVVNDFKGMLPRRAERLLVQNYAEEADNCELLTGAVQGFHQLEFLKQFDHDVKYAYRIPALPDLWIDFDSFDADVVRSPLINDAHERYYFTEPGEDPKYTTLLRIGNEDPPYRLGVPRPTQQPTVVADGLGNPPIVTRAYSYAFVTTLGEIGPGADPRLEDGNDDDTWTVSNIQAVPPDNVDRDITHVNIYRTITSTSGITSYFYVDQIPIGTTSYIDSETTPNISLNEQYDGFTWDPPVAGMYGMVRLPNGSLAGFLDDNLYFSEPYRPHAWPPEYTLAVDYPIVGLSVYQNYLVICTSRSPYIAIGGHPAQLSLSQMAGIEPCLSKSSIIPATEGVYYASQNGLVLLTTAGLMVSTSTVISRNDWRGNYNPEQIKAARLGTRYIAFEGENPGEGFVIDPAEEAGSISDLRGIGTAINAITDDWNGEVNIIDANGVYQWDKVGTSRFPFRWKSKEFQIKEPVNFGVFMAHFGRPPIIDGLPDNEGPEDPTFTGVLDVKIWAGPTLIFDDFVSNREARRIPSGVKHDVWQFEVSGNVELFSFAMAETGKELSQV